MNLIRWLRYESNDKGRKSGLFLPYHLKFPCLFIGTPGFVADKPSPLNFLHLFRFAVWQNIH
jgi:hypothetical protein